MSRPSFGGAVALRGGDDEHQHGHQHLRQQAHLLAPRTRVLYFSARRPSTGKASHFCICLRDDIVSTTEYRYCSNRYSQKVASRCQIFLKNAGTKFRTSRILYSACHERRSLVMHRRILVVQPYGTGSKSSEKLQNCQCVQCVYSVCTLCAAKPHRHRMSPGPRSSRNLHHQKAAVQQIMH